MTNLMEIEDVVYRFNKKLDELVFSLISSDTPSDWKNASIIFKNKVKTTIQSGEITLFIDDKKELQNLNDTLKSIYRRFINFINDKYYLHCVLF